MPATEGQSASGQSQPEQSKQSQLPKLASLRLLREMQTLINQQSEPLLSGSIDDEPARARMADRQEALAEQVSRSAGASSCSFFVLPFFVRFCI